MNYPAASCGVSKDLYDNFPNVVTPECFIGGPDPDSPVVSRVEPPLKTCGNDRLQKENQFDAASCGEYDPRRFKAFPSSRMIPQRAW